jgi:hypothetical protein
MDILVTVMLVAMLLLVVILGAAVFVQQSGSLRELRDKLQSVQDEARNRKNPDTLRRERVAVLDPLLLLETQLSDRAPLLFTEEELGLIAASRERIMTISQQLKALNDWIGAPYDLEWVEYLERLPMLKSLYLSADIGQDGALPPTSGS